jgi:starch-binding outer membrane protein, SusD/RagB family
MRKINNPINRKTINIFCIVLLFTALTACEEFIEVGPPKTEIVTATVFTNDASATSTISGIYSLMMNNQGFTRAGMDEFSGLLSDELTNHIVNADQIQFYTNELTPKNSYVLAIFWREAYKYIHNANALLAGLEVSRGITSTTRNQLEGEAYFIRAFCHFYLVNLFGDVPYLTTTDYRVNMKEARIPAVEVYGLIERDLLKGRELMSSDFSFSGDERVRPNQDAATALLARLYLYTKDWNKAEQFSSDLISKLGTYKLENLADVFRKESTEAIWQLKPVAPQANTPQAQIFILNGPPNTASRRVSMSDALFNSFEADDMRASEWIGEYTQDAATWHYPYKYKKLSDPVQSEYSVVFRLAEQYLIRAEARTQLGKYSEAQQDLNTIRERAGLPATTSNDKPDLLLAIEQERRSELFAEWGHRWFDLVRTDRAHAVLGPLKSGWQETDILLPIPDSERLLNPNLSQNPGY